MFVRPSVLIALIFLLAGGARPACMLVKSMFPQDKIEFASDDQDEEREDASDNESDSEDETLKILVSKVSFFSSYDVVERAYTAYLPVFSEHHPDVITPPPRG